MDTSNDFRIRLAEKGVEELENSLSNIRLQRRKELVKEISGLKSEIQILKYSYMPFRDLAEYESTIRISKVAESALERVMEAERDFHQINSRFWLDYLSSLPSLLGRGDIERAYEAVRYFSGKIVSTTEMGENLWLCSFDCGFKMEIVTNSKEFRAGTEAVVSFLPPRQFGNAVSEGMFVSARIGKMGELTHDEILSIGESLGEVEAVILNVI